MTPQAQMIYDYITAVYTRSELSNQALRKQFHCDQRYARQATAQLRADHLAAQIETYCKRHHESIHEFYAEMRTNKRHRQELIELVRSEIR